MAEMERFIDNALTALTSPINEYFDVAENAPEGDHPQQQAHRSLVLTMALRRTQREFLNALHDTHTQAAMIADGEKHLSAEGRAQLSAVIREQIVYANGFMAALPDMSRATAIVRARSYVSAIIQTMSLIAVSDLPELPNTPGDGQTECKSWCKCRLRVVRRGSRDWDVYWDLTPAEHCPDCIELSQTWNPLEIRDGAIVSQKSIAPHLRAIAYLAALEAA